MRSSTRSTTAHRRGREAATATIPVEIPRGVADGLEVRMPGEGHAGRSGGPPGDLYLGLDVAPHPVFERRGQDLFAVLDVPLTVAALGGAVEVATLDGTERVTIDAGTQPGAVLRLRGEGIPNLGRRGRGDLFLSVAVEVPRRLDRDERELLERLARLRPDAAPRLRHPKEDR